MVASPPIDLAAAELLAIGPLERRARLQNAMRDLGPLVRGVDTVADALARIGDNTAAIVLIADNGGRSAVARLRGALADRDLPIVVIVDPGTSSGHAVAGYDAGATAVLEWPTEVLLVHDLLRELLDLHDTEHPHAAGDVALTEAVNARLRLDEVLGDNARCRVVGSTAVIRGELASLWERDRMIRLVEAVPGISHVVDHGIVIRVATVPDAMLDETVSGVVRSAGNVEARGLATSVSGGVVTMTGHAAPEVAQRVRNALRSIPGVRRVFDFSSTTEGAEP